MSKPPRIRYFAKPEVWALAQNAYLVGESAPSIAHRLGLTVGGIRKRAARKGWTRAAAVEAQRANETPAAMCDAALVAIGRAARVLRERDDIDEAERLVSTAERLLRALRTWRSVDMDVGS